MARILIVDDNLLNLELAQDVLELGGHIVDTADNAGEGFELAKSVQPDLILMDLRMPGTSGLDALHQLRADATTQKIPVVVLTASAMKGDEHRLLAEGFDGYLQKPIDPPTFAETVASLLNHKSS